MAASTLARTQTEPRGPLDLSALSGLASPPRDDLADLAGVEPAPSATPEPPLPAANLADLASLGAIVERDSPANDPVADAAAPLPEPSPARPAAPMADLAGLASLGSNVERDSPADTSQEPAAPGPVAEPSRPAIAPRTPIRQMPRVAVSAAPVAAVAKESSPPDLNQVLLDSGRDFAVPGADPISGIAPPAYRPDAVAHEGPMAGLHADAPTGEAAAGEEGKKDEDDAPKAAPFRIEPLRPEGEIAPEDAFYDPKKASQVIEAAIRGMRADPASLELAKRWQDIDSAHGLRYAEQAEEVLARHKALENMRAPLLQGGGEQGGARGGTLISIGRGLAGLGRRGVEARRRAALREATDELANMREDYQVQATDLIRGLFAAKSRHYDDRLQEMGFQHADLNDAIGRYNRAFADAPTAAPFAEAVDAYGREKGISRDEALLAAAAGKAGPAVAAALATVKGATLADPAVHAARAEMREAEELFTDTAHRARNDFESLLRFSTPEDGFDAEKSSEKLQEAMEGYADRTKDPLAEDEDKAKMRERMRELANSIQRMIKEMFEKMFRAVTGAFGR